MCNLPFGNGEMFFIGSTGETRCTGRRLTKKRDPGTLTAYNRSVTTSNFRESDESVTGRRSS